MSPKAIAAIQSNTRIMLQATARAAVRGEDIETAIARVAPYLQGRAIGQTVDILAKKKD
jgi:nitrogenase molybdenum-iron protein alpha/beta subunit